MVVVDVTGGRTVSASSLLSKNAGDERLRPHEQGLELG